MAHRAASTIDDHQPVLACPRSSPG